MTAVLDSTEEKFGNLGIKLKRLQYRWSIGVFISELLSKKWMEPIIPLAILLILVAFFSTFIPNFLVFNNIQALFHEFAELGFLCIGMGLVLLSGGIDLSVGAVYGLCDVTALILYQGFGMPTIAVAICTIALGTAIGAFNGLLIGYFRSRSFLTTLATLIIVRAIQEMTSLAWSDHLARSQFSSESWNFLGNGSIFGLPVNFMVLILLMVAFHLFLGRMRYGWHIIAIGSSRKAARHAGVKIQKILFFTYLISGGLAGLSGLFYAARQMSAGYDTGVGLEITVLTAVVIGGVSLAGGKGTTNQAIIGGAIIFLLMNGLVRMGMIGGSKSFILGLIFLLAVSIDVKWAKNRAKVIQKMFVNPTFVLLKKVPSTLQGRDSPYAENNALEDAEGIGVGQIEGPEDVILDRQNRIYCGDRHGWIIRFSGVNSEHREEFARIGGRPLGLAFDRDENLIVCVGGMGLYGVTPAGKVYKLTNETNRTWHKVIDDSRMNLADDLDIAPDGKIYFSEATIRYDAHSWMLDQLEGRGNGRLICYDPYTKTTRTLVRNLVLPNGVCISHDGQSALIVSSWYCCINRYWIAGPKKGYFEPFVDVLPGVPDNMNRASDGGYWVAFAGMRSPAYDLCYRMPGFRRRMYKTLPMDEWLFMGMNHGGVVKLDANGKPQYSLWDPSGKKHPLISSMREHKGYLYLAGLENNRLGRIKLQGVDETWNGYESYWGKK